MNQFPVANEPLQDCGPIRLLQFIERQIARVHALEHSNGTGDPGHESDRDKRARFFAIRLRTLLIEAATRNAPSRKPVRLRASSEAASSAPSRSRLIVCMPTTL